MTGCSIEVMDPWFLGICGALTIGFQFVSSLVWAAGGVADWAGGANFAFLSLFTLFLNGDANLRQVLVSLAVILWGIRLGAFLTIRRIAKRKEDPRFPKRVITYWLFQGIWVYVVFSPIMLLNSACGAEGLEVGQEWGWSLDTLGFALFTFGFFIELASDHQKFMFELEDANEGKFCDIGFWGWSRHPNYFGEILVWWGIWVLCLPVFYDHPIFWVASVSPVFVSLAILAVTGVPMLEKIDDQKFEKLEPYRAYKACTSPLVPLPPGVYSSFPDIVKAIFCFEIPNYTSYKAEYTKLDV